MTYARCGGTFLAQLIGSTGVLGRPEDWFNGQGYRNRGHRDYPLSREGQLAMWRSQGASANGVVGLKLSLQRLKHMAGFDWTRDLENVHFVHLTRADRLARAISEARAHQTRQYRSTSVARGQPRYDAALIRRFIVEQAHDEALTRTYFATNGIVPLELTYEEVVADESGALARIAGLLGVDEQLVPDRSLIELEVQRDDINRDWRERFLAEHRDLGHFNFRAASWAARLADRLRPLLTS